MPVLGMAKGLGMTLEDKQYSKQVSPLNIVGQTGSKLLPCAIYAEWVGLVGLVNGLVLIQLCGYISWPSLKGGHTFKWQQYFHAIDL